MATHLGSEFTQHIACLTATGEVYEQLAARGVPIHQFGREGRGISDPRVHAQLFRLIRQVKPHIVHGAVFEGMVWGGIAGLLSRVPIVFLEETSHPDDTSPQGMRRSRKARLLIRTIANHSDGVVAVAPSIGNYLVKEGGIPSDRVHVILNGVADFPLANVATALAERRRLSLPDSAFVIGGVGRLFERHKRFSDLLRVVKELRVNRDVRALIVGDGPDRPLLEARARELGVEDAVVFAGRREDRGLFFPMMDLFVLSSATEAAPLALMEAMMAARPCIATLVGGVPDIAVNGESALLVEPGDFPQLLDAVARLTTDEALRARLALGARRTAEQHLTGERYAADVRALYLSKIRPPFHAIPRSDSQIGRLERK